MDFAGRSYCPHCLKPTAGYVEVDTSVWLSRRCPVHGHIRTKLYRDPYYLAKAIETSRAAHQPHRCLVVEVTERCDVGCATCSASSICSGTEKTVSELVEEASRRSRKLGARVIALSGGEPLIRPDIWQIADAMHEVAPRIVLITSGRGFETEPGILEAIASRRAWLEVYLQFDSLDDEVLRALRTPETTAVLRRQRLAESVATGAPTTAVCVVPPNQARSTVGQLAAFCREQGAAGVTFQPLRQLGRFPHAPLTEDQLTAVDEIQFEALRGLGAKSLRPQPFAQQPFDISVAFVEGDRVAWPCEFFTEDLRRAGFRVATASYWDHTNYFEPMATSGHYYFYSAERTPLNARYFPAAGVVAKPTMERPSATGFAR